MTAQPSPARASPRVRPELPALYPTLAARHLTWRRPYRRVGARYPRPRLSLSVTGDWHHLKADLRSSRGHQGCDSRTICMCGRSSGGWRCIKIQVGPVAPGNNQTRPTTRGPWITAHVTAVRRGSALHGPVRDCPTEGLICALERGRSAARGCPCLAWLPAAGRPLIRVMRGDRDQNAVDDRGELCVRRREVVTGHCAASRPRLAQVRAGHRTLASGCA